MNTDLKSALAILEQAGFVFDPDDGGQYGKIDLNFNKIEVGGHPVIQYYRSVFICDFNDACYVSSAISFAPNSIDPIPIYIDRMATARIFASGKTYTEAANNFLFRLKNNLYTSI